ncbi:gliding motility-associated C-terminal domain-containing protein [Galbibacter sp. BG1]|uniref:T9SS type B sorting domain-containing protein n=1 Tax=Galbibacter sp. BG1 TaxID=1170699 RepID=UPI0015BC86DE|nr:gliding motility-associated C-terminal domain-containing protein [Galbibacter sp. BG1]QLE01025.1 gliding motility-associated C-terminal domain-containing protein [Galbibacter sp. BG1]
MPYSFNHTKAFGYLLLFLVCFYAKSYTQNSNEPIVLTPGSTLTINAFSEGATGYVWLRNNTVIENYTESSYLVTKDGSYAAIAYNDQDCTSEISDTIRVLFVEDDEEEPDDPIFGVQYFCGRASPTLMDIETYNENIVWFSSEDITESLPATTVLEEGRTYYGVNPETNTKFNVEVFLDYCIDFAIQKEVDRARVSKGEQVTFTITLTNTSGIDGKDIMVTDKLPSGFEYVNHTTNIGTYNSTSGIWEIQDFNNEEMAVLKILVKVADIGSYLNTATLEYSSPEDFITENNVAEAEVFPNCLNIYNILTPNNDGKNDTFTIACIEDYPNNKLQIFNRNGSLVYSKNGYRNSWDGVASVKGVVNRDGKLPSGVYYYVLELDENTKAMTGWLYIAY